MCGPWRCRAWGAPSSNGPLYWLMGLLCSLWVPRISSTDPRSLERVMPLLEPSPPGEVGWVMSLSLWGEAVASLNGGARPARHLMGTIDVPSVHCGPAGAAGVCGLLADGYQYLDAFGGTPIYQQPPLRGFVAGQGQPPSETGMRQWRRTLIPALLGRTSPWRIRLGQMDGRCGNPLWLTPGVRGRPGSLPAPIG